MDPSLLPEQDVLSIQDDNSVPYLLTQGLHCMRQGHNVEGMAFFVRIRKQLLANQTSLVTVIDTFIHSYEEYTEALEHLLLASKIFAQVDAEHQRLLTEIEKLMPELEQDTADAACSEQVSEHTDHCQPITHSPEGTQQAETVTPCHVIKDEQERPCLPTLHVTCFGHFAVRRMQQLLPLCPNRNGQAIMRYLTGLPDHSATVDRLMEILWPNEEVDVALRRLRIATSALRRSLNEGYECHSGGGYILCKNGVYYLNPAVSFASDVDEFLNLYRLGQKLKCRDAASYYERACTLYTGPFLLDDLYADWSFARREQLSQVYLVMCRVLATNAIETKIYSHAVHWSSAIIKESPCDEQAYRYLMWSYAALGQRSEALRQYQRCQQVLQEELGVQPVHETLQLLQSLKNGNGDMQQIDLK